MLQRHHRSMSHSHAPVMSSYSTSAQMQNQGQVTPSALGPGHEIPRPESRKETIVYNVSSQPVAANSFPNGATTSMNPANPASQQRHEVCACVNHRELLQSACLLILNVAAILTFSKSCTRGCPRNMRGRGWHQALTRGLGQHWDRIRQI